ncbi:ABC transporter ATP-binding protein [Leptolyngbya sp. FACHB-17]|uniref:ABC transporter ATP-binding protein n=1 Tax=unclassified Leptolyngbya TaxID=2650499 RepID=UPI0016817149|nr:ABC transporter ATP-binding protein [Leptolyngbya sp. FACHB-17]MBD2078969.1 ABC transporter ATP-binding protein [Leptolyngbya sp. FACHB-17]
MSEIKTDHLKISYGDAIVVPDLSIALHRGGVTALIGANGSGKSTILRTISRLLSPTQGVVCLDGRDIAKLKTKDLARRLAFLPQSQEAPSRITVRELIAYGRYPYQGLFKPLSSQDQTAIDWALTITGLEPLAYRSVDTLSGGERQRAWIAMALAQQTQVLLLDEPTTYLDIRHQQEILLLVRRLNREQGLTVGWVLHDLNQAAMFSDWLILLRQGQVYAQGRSEQVMKTEILRETFGTELVIVPHPQTGKPMCLHSVAEEF